MQTQKSSAARYETTYRKVSGKNVKFYIKVVPIGKDCKIRLYSLDKSTWDSSIKILLYNANRIETIMRDGTSHERFGEKSREAIDTRHAKVVA